MSKLKACIKPPPLRFPAPPRAATWSFNAIINRLSTENAHNEVLDTFSSMQSTNTATDTHSYPSLLKACSSLGNLSLGLSIHCNVIFNGYGSDSYISSSLVGFYSGFCMVVDAQKVFDEMSGRNVVSWTAVIGCWSRMGEVDRAFGLFNRMMNDGVFPNSVTLLSLLYGVSEGFRLECLHGSGIQSGLFSDVNLVNCMLHVYAKCGRIEDARDLFEEMEEKDIVSWNSMVSGYAQIGNDEETIRLLRRMRMDDIEPDQQTFATILMSLSDIELGRFVHGQMITAGVVVDAPLATSLIIFYSKLGHIGTAFTILKRISNKDAILWTAMISGLVQNNCADMGIMVFNEMLQSGVRPLASTISTVIAGCSQISSLTIGKSVHGYLLRQGIYLDTPVMNSLITMYAKSGHLMQSSQIFNNIRERDVVSWNAIVSGYAENGDLYGAFLLFNEMRFSHPKPDSITTISLLRACASFGALEQGKCVHSFAIKLFLRPNILVDTAVVDMYSKCGDLYTAQKCFDHMPEHDIVSWSTIIAGYGSHGMGVTALELFSSFLHSGLEPNHAIFLSALFACSHSRLVSEGFSLFKSMTKDFGLEPQLEHRATVVDLLCRAGRLEEAYNFMKAMISEPTLEVLGILLDACRAKGNTVLGETIARDIAEMKPVSAEKYVRLAQSYASINRWNGVGEAWAQMRSLGLKKLPGWSSIELHGESVTFYTSSSSHPLCQEMMMIFEVLWHEMQDRNHNKSS